MIAAGRKKVSSLQWTEKSRAGSMLRSSWPTQIGHHGFYWPFCLFEKVEQLGWVVIWEEAGRSWATVEYDSVLYEILRE